MTRKLKGHRKSTHSRTTVCLRNISIRSREDNSLIDAFSPIYTAQLSLISSGSNEPGGSSRTAVNSDFRSIEQLETLLLPSLDGRLIYRRVTPQLFLLGVSNGTVAGTHLYTWVKGDNVE